MRRHLLLDRYLPERLARIGVPDVHGPDQGVAVDEVQLEGQDAKEESAIGSRP